MRALDLAGQRFGRLVALSVERVGSYRVWLCRCDCGGTAQVPTGTLNYGRVKSCGCVRRESAKRMGDAISHGQARRSGATGAYRSWRNMCRRCAEPDNIGYPNYGGRGIEVCTRWQTFSNFLEDMGPRPPQLEIDRIDNSKGYEPGNCRWTDRAAQSRNRRSTVIVAVGDQKMCAADAGKIIGLNKGLVARRLRTGWTDYDAVYTPSRKG